MCSDSPSPDPLIGQAAKANADIAKEALAWYKEQYAAQRPRQAQLDALSSELANQQINASRFNNQQAREQWNRYQSVGIPVEDAMYRDAANFDSEANQAKVAGQAATDVQAAMDSAAQAKRMALERSGVNPADGQSLDTENQIAAQTALGKAAAMNSARNQVKGMGVMLRKDAASFARGMPSTAAQTYGVASAAGRDATGAVQGAIASSNQSMQTAGQGFSTAIQGNNSAGSILNQEYGNQVQAARGDNVLGGIGGLAQGIGAAGGIGKFFSFSDKHMKTDIRDFDEDDALDGMKKLGVKRWKYKSDSDADDGGQEHVGAMAQDMNKHLGDQVAPGGKMVDMVSAIGVNMAATKALAKKVDKLESVIRRGVRK